MKELIIKQIENYNIITLVENGELVEKYQENINNKSIEGNIYIGKVQNILPGLQSAFINIGERKNAFIHVKDILPKKDITKEAEVEDVPINQLIKPGDPIIVEVKRESVEHKGPKVSTHINVVGRFVVFMPNATFITVSQKIEDRQEKERLKSIVEKILPDGTGAIIRTVAKDRTKSEIEKDLEKSIDEWNKIQSKKVEDFPQKIYSKGRNTKENNYRLS